jgi:hypothetical protein
LEIVFYFLLFSQNTLRNSARIAEVLDSKGFRKGMERLDETHKRTHSLRKGMTRYMTRGLVT